MYDTIYANVVESIFYVFINVFPNNDNVSYMTRVAGESEQVPVVAKVEMLNALTVKVKSIGSKIY